VPVAQVPLVATVLNWLREGGITDTTVCANGASRAVASVLRDGRELSMRLTYHEDHSPRGAAGCIRDAGSLSDAHTFVVADGTAVPVVDLDDLLASHERSGASLTVVVQPDSANAAAGLTPTGIYIVDRRVMESIAAAGFQDIKENLIPKLYGDGNLLLPYRAEAGSPRVLNAETYLAANCWTVARLFAYPALPACWSEYLRMDNALVHPTAWADPAAQLIGPVLLGPGVRVGAGATIVGPTSLGPQTVVGRNALVSRSVSWNDCVIESGAIVDGCVLTDHVTVTADRPLFRTVRVRTGKSDGTLASRWRARQRPEHVVPHLPLPSLR
jgi:mannose-1-phosphate guanylyltransferase